MAEAPFVKIATLELLPKGALLEVEHKGELYAICNVDGQIRALFGECPHEGGPLGQGNMEGPLITCPWHCWQFDSLTGVCVQGDDVVLETYPVKIEGNDVLVQLPEADY
jgi:nitrite reductase/ring-hydroxylating ferredoxin subunit